MIDADFVKFWDAIPVGEDQAAAASQIRRRLDMWARSTIQHKLYFLAETGQINRISRPLPMGGEKQLYFRKA
jgi:predicted transcriptional regulator